MTESNAWDVLKNPLALQKQILEDYENRLDSDVEVLKDSNNTFMFLLETFGRNSANLTECIDGKLIYQYPRRASDTEELYDHISDFDYVGFFSEPAPLPLKFYLHKDFIIDNAIEVPGTNYKKITIPKDSIFEIGRYKFSLYYPIDIRVNPIAELKVIDGKKCT